jgi:hypothetical protein
MLEQVEQRRFSPVDVLDDERQRTLARAPLERLPDRPEDLLRRAGRECRLKLVLGTRLAEDLDEPWTLPTSGASSRCRFSTS